MIDNGEIVDMYSIFRTVLALDYGTSFMAAFFSPGFFFHKKNKNVCIKKNY